MRYKYFDRIMKLFGHKIEKESYEPVTAFGIIVKNNGIAHAGRISMHANYPQR